MNPGLYLHLPFCSAICPYCDFSVLTGGAERRERFVDDLRVEIRLWGERWRGRDGAFDTVYLGGGTPSALAPRQLASLLEAVREHLPLAADAWVSLEANPEDVDAASLAAWRELGVSTVSLGVQSFADQALRFLGRRHTGEQARRAVEAALAAGFPAVNVDLIYGLPEQRAEAWQRDLDAATALAPQHLSCYQLTIHGGTPFGFRLERGRLRELPDERQAELFRLTHRRLAERGWPGYEISNFARAPEHRSPHNRKYWSHTPYLGLGPSAHSFDGERRWWNHRKVGPWQAALARGEAPVEAAETLGPAELGLERLMLGLRTAEGVDLGALRRLGLALAPEDEATVEAFERQGLLRRRGERLVPTLDGWAVADTLARSLRLSPAPAPLAG